MRECIFDDDFRLDNVARIRQRLIFDSSQHAQRIAAPRAPKEPVSRPAQSVFQLPVAAVHLPAPTNQWRTASTCQVLVQAITAITSIGCVGCVVVGVEWSAQSLLFLQPRRFRQTLHTKVDDNSSYERFPEGQPEIMNDQHLDFAFSYSFRFFAFWSRLCSFRARLTGFRTIVRGSVSYHCGEQENCSYADSQSFWCTKYSSTIVELAKQNSHPSLCQCDVIAKRWF